MAAPEYVPTDPMARVRTYRSSPRRPESWTADRPGDLVEQPRGTRLGTPGPDLGYARKLARSFEDRLPLTKGENRDDVIAGCVAIAMKRASLFGRAPVVHDLSMGFMLWGFLDDKPPDDLVATRRRMFEGVSHPAHHYVELRQLVDAVPDSTLHLTLDQAAEGHSAHWQGLLDLAEEDLPQGRRRASRVRAPRVS